MQNSVAGVTLCMYGVNMYICKYVVYIYWSVCVGYFESVKAVSPGQMCPEALELVILSIIQH